MSEKRKKFDWEFRERAVRIVREMGKSIAAVARGTWGFTRTLWVVG
jgi:transposase